MTPENSVDDRCVYAFHVGNHIYIGLTYNLEKRAKAHIARGNAYARMVKATGDRPVFTRLTGDMPEAEASAAEIKLMRDYARKGYVLYNKTKGGGLGGLATHFGGKDKPALTKQACLDSAARYSTRNQWHLAETAFYVAAKNRGWFDECVAHMPVAAHHKHSRESLLESALRFSEVPRWREQHESEYRAAIRHGCLDEIREAMKRKKGSEKPKMECD